MAAIVIFFGDAIALMFAKKLGLQNWEVCVAGALLMVICKVLKPKEASGSIPISMLLLIVGSQAMAGALSVTGAGEFIGGHIAALVKLVDGNSYAVGFIFFLIPFILIQAACLSAFMTPMATSAVPYIMECGGYDQTSMIKQGLLYSVIACVVSVGWIMTLYPIL